MVMTDIHGPAVPLAEDLALRPLGRQRHMRDWNDTYSGAHKREAILAAAPPPLQRGEAVVRLRATLAAAAANLPHPARRARRRG